MYEGFGSRLSEAMPPQLSLDDVVSMTPLEIANSSHLVISAYKELVQGALSIRNDEYRKPMLDVLRDPKVTFPEKYGEGESTEMDGECGGEDEHREGHCDRPQEECRTPRHGEDSIQSVGHGRAGTAAPVKAI